jgi:plasmid maintenance system antidote protein VapI
VDKVKIMIAAGVSVPTAVKEALRMSVAAFAEKHALSRTTVSSQLSGRIALNAPLIDALIAELGGTADQWIELYRDVRTVAIAS